LLIADKALNLLRSSGRFRGCSFEEPPRWWEDLRRRVGRLFEVDFLVVFLGDEAEDVGVREGDGGGSGVLAGETGSFFFLDPLKKNIGSEVDATV